MFSLNETPYDLRFKVMGIPVRVHPGFWVIGLLMGWQNGRLDLTAAWLGCIFVSILVHELGHALSARAFGWPPQIVLYHFGGLAMFSPNWNYTKWRAIWISFAGPFAGFLLFGVMLVVEQLLVAAYRAEQPWAVRLLVSNDNSWTTTEFVIVQMKFINLWWGLVNLLPVWPLDGGQICEQLCDGRRSISGRRLAHQIGMIIGGLAAAFFFGGGQLYPALLFGGLAYENYRRMTISRQGYW